MTDEQDGAGFESGNGEQTRAGGGRRANGAGSGTRNGTRNGTGRRRRPKKEHGTFFKVFWRTVLGFVALGLIGIVALVIIYLRTPIPQPQANAAKQVSIVYYSDGKTELGRFSTVNREDVTIDKIPKQVRYEFLAAEDRNFYKNSGVSVSGTLRAAWSTLSGGQEQGGSTITQQYVKNYFLTQDRSVKRKVNEIMIALKIDHKMSKDDILDAYLNNIYFGRGAYGIQAASQAYFGVDVDKINASQGAFLASVINAPGLYDPQYGAAAEARANARMTYVLDGMVKEGWMTKAERAKAHMPTFKKYKPNAQQVSGPNGYIVSSVRAELEKKLKLKPEDIDRGGLRITTTIDKNSQKAAVAAVHKNVPSQTARLDSLHTGLVAEKPDGAVVAMYGGEDVSKNASSTTNASLQGGSSFKAFALTAALQDGMTMQTRFSGAAPLVITGAKGKPTKITNDNHEQFGQLTLERAFAVSSNTAFVRLNQALGTGKTLAAAQQLGIPADVAKDPSDVDVLGYAAVHVIDMANAYNTISAEGKKADPYFIKKVSSSAGDYSYDAHPSSTQAVSKDIAANLVNGMTGPLTDADGTAHATAGQLNRPAAGKTGTSSNYKSAWFTGFTPNQLTASVGMYAGNGPKSGTVGLDKATHDSSFYGGATPATIWRDFMQAALKGEKVAKLPDTKDVKSTKSYSPPPVTSTTTQPPSTSSSTSEPSTPSSTSSSSSSSSTSTTTTPTTTEPPSPTTTTTTTTPPPVSTTVPTRPTSPVVPPPANPGGQPKSTEAPTP